MMFAASVLYLLSNVYDLKQYCMMKDPVLFAIDLEKEAIHRELSTTFYIDTNASHASTWVHLDASHPDVESWLSTHATHLDILTIQALLAEETRPRFEEMSGGVLLILRGVNLNQDENPEDMLSIRLWVGRHHIISLQRHHLMAVHDIKRHLLTVSKVTNSVTVMVDLIIRLLERMEPTFSRSDDRIDDLEEIVLSQADPSVRSDIVHLRRETIKLRRYIAPQRDAVSRLRHSELDWLDDKQKKRLQEAIDRLNRFVENLDAIRERSHIVQDELSTALADRLNKNMYILSVVAAIFLPLGFLTGLLGVNVGGIPGGDNPYAFILCCAGLTLLSALQLMVFKKLKWL